MTHSRKIKLKKLNNMRDLGGIVCADGRTVVRGKLLRSGKMSDLPQSTVEAIKSAGVTTIVDFRLPAERNDHPDTIIDGIRYFWFPVVCTPAEHVECERTMRLTMKKESFRLKKEFDNMDDYMLETYRSILFNSEPQRALSHFLRLVIDEEGCILWHCASGKDRAGICSMLVEALLGADESALIEDYTASRKSLRKRYFLNRLGLIVAPISFKFKWILFGYMRIKPEYLKAVMDEMIERYGSIVGYCKKVLGITDRDIEKLRAKYLY